jgi:hypothetical protein
MNIIQADHLKKTFGPVTAVNDVSLAVREGEIFACSPLTFFTDLIRYSFTGEHFFPVVVDISALGVFTLVFHRRNDVPAQKNNAQKAMIKEYIAPTGVI